MERIIINVSDVLPYLTKAVSVVAPKNTMAILADVLVKTYRNSKGESMMMITGSDGENTLSVAAPVEESEPDIRFAVNAKDFLNVLSTLGGHTVALEKDNEANVINGIHESGKFTVPFDNPDEYPTQRIDDKDSRSEVIMDAQVLLVSMTKPLFAVGNSTVRPSMNGLRFDFKGDALVTVGLSHSRIARYTRNNVNGADGTGFTLPTKPATVLSKILTKTEGDVKVSFSDRDVVVSKSDFRFIARLQEGNYPKYDKVIPQETPIVWVISKEELLDALKRILPMGNESSSIRMELTEGKVTLKAEFIEYSKSASEEITVGYHGEDMSIGINGSLLMENVSNIDDDMVTIGIISPSAPVVIKAEHCEEYEDYISLINPLVLA